MRLFTLIVLSLSISAFAQVSDNNAVLRSTQFVESSNNPRAVGRHGERGLFQLTEAAWKQVSDEKWDDAFDPAINRKVALRYFQWIERTLTRWMGRKPTTEQVLAAYNGGIGRLRRVGYDVQKMPASTRAYVRKIMAGV